MFTVMQFTSSHLGQSVCGRLQASKLVSEERRSEHNASGREENLVSL